MINGDPIYELDQNGTMELKVCKNSYGQKIYVTSIQNLPEDFEICETVKTSKCKKNMLQLQVFHLPLRSPDSPNRLEFLELDLHLFQSSRNGQINFNNANSKPLICDNLAIVAENKCNILH